jgi:hypothetical protein
MNLKRNILKWKRSLRKCEYDMGVLCYCMYSWQNIISLLKSTFSYEPTHGTNWLSIQLKVNFSTMFTFSFKKVWYWWKIVRGWKHHTSTTKVALSVTVPFQNTTQTYRHFLRRKRRRQNVQARKQFCFFCIILYMDWKKNGWMCRVYSVQLYLLFYQLHAHLCTPVSKRE